MADETGRLGLVAGGGGLPLEIARLCRQTGRPYFVVRLKGFAAPELAEHPGGEAGLAEFGRITTLLRDAGCRTACFCGYIRRPDFSALKPDLKGLMYLPGVAAAAAHGDDALLRAVLAAFEREGFEIEGVGQAGAALTLPSGALGAVAPALRHQADIGLALDEARALGRSDVGQAAIVRHGAVIAREDSRGTDAMLAGCVQATGGGDRAGVLAKTPKPAQDLRVDLPTIGPATVEGAARAGLAGVVGPAGQVLVVQREAVIAAADRLGLFVVGVEEPAP